MRIRPGAPEPVTGTSAPRACVASIASEPPLCRHLPRHRQRRIRDHVLLAAAEPLPIEYSSLTLGHRLAALHILDYVLNGRPGVAGCKGPGTTSELQLLTTGSPASTFLMKGSESTSEPFTAPLCVRPG